MIEEALFFNHALRAHYQCQVPCRSSTRVARNSWTDAGIFMYNLDQHSQFTADAPPAPGGSSSVMAPSSAAPRSTSAACWPMVPGAAPGRRTAASDRGRRGRRAEKETCFASAPPSPSLPGMRRTQEQADLDEEFEGRFEAPRVGQRQRLAALEAGRDLLVGCGDILDDHAAVRVASRARRRRLNNCKIRNRVTVLATKPRL